MITYNPNDPRDVLEAHKQLDFLILNRIPFKLGKVEEQRTTQQNNFYHLCLRYYASQIGLTLTDAEREMKECCNPSIFVRETYDKRGNPHTIIRSSADLTKDEMTSAINNFRVYAETYAEVSIPYETDYAFIKECKREIEKTKAYT